MIFPFFLIDIISICIIFSQFSASLILFFGFYNRRPFCSTLTTLSFDSLSWFYSVSGVMQRVGQIFSCANPGEALIFFFFHCVSQPGGAKIVSEINDPGKNEFQNK